MPEDKPLQIFHALLIGLAGFMAIDVGAWFLRTASAWSVAMWVYPWRRAMVLQAVAFLAVASLLPVVLLLVAPSDGWYALPALAVWTLLVLKAVPWYWGHLSTWAWVRLLREFPRLSLGGSWNTDAKLRAIRAALRGTKRDLATPPLRWTFDLRLEEHLEALSPQSWVSKYVDRQALLPVDVLGRLLCDFRGPGRAEQARAWAILNLAALASRSTRESIAVCEWAYWEGFHQAAQASLGGHLKATLQREHTLQAWRTNPEHQSLLAGLQAAARRLEEEPCN
jgi:hypothetical protein